MSTFIHKPLDESDVDILSEPDAISPLNPVLGIRRSLFMQPMEDIFIKEGEVVDKVNVILEDLRPYIESDGGSIKFVDIKNGWVRLSFEGACGSCAVSAGTLLIIEEQICTEIPELKGVESLQDE